MIRHGENGNNQTKATFLCMDANKNMLLKNTAPDMQELFSQLNVSIAKAKKSNISKLTCYPDSDWCFVLILGFC